MKHLVGIGLTAAVLLTGCGTSAPTAPRTPAVSADPLNLLNDQMVLSAAWDQQSDASHADTCAAAKSFGYDWEAKKIADGSKGAIGTPAVVAFLRSKC
jgi:hypothetical protein